MPLPLHDAPIIDMVSRPNVPAPVEYGNDTSFWVEYPTGLVDLSRTDRLPSSAVNTESSPPPLKSNQAEIEVDGGRIVRINKETTAIVIIDMQKWAKDNKKYFTYSFFFFNNLVEYSFFLHPDLRAHPLGLKCVEPLMQTVPALRSIGVKILWV